MTIMAGSPLLRRVDVNQTGKSSLKVECPLVGGLTMYHYYSRRDCRGRHFGQCRRNEFGGGSAASPGDNLDCLDRLL